MKSAMKRVTAYSLAVAGIFGATSANAQTYYSINSGNASVGTMNLSASTLSNSSLPSMTVGSNPFSFATVSFVPTTSAAYTFGQSSAPVDTVMVLYLGAFNPASPSAGVLQTNDDTGLAAHQAAIGTARTVSCAGSTSLCPQVTSQVVAGQRYTVLVSTYRSGATFALPLDYYATGGQGTFSNDSIAISPQQVYEFLVAEAMPTVRPQVQRATSVQQATIISSVLSNVFSSRATNSPGAPKRVSLDSKKTGMAAGDGPAKLNAWSNVSDTTIGSSATASMFNGNVNNLLVGVDYRVSNEFVAGVSTGYDRVKLDFKFAGLTNSGMTSDGWMVAPYASYQVNEMISVDGVYGHASGDVDTRAIGLTTNQTYSRNFLALNLNANYWLGDWQFTGKANYIAAQEKITTTNKIEQLRLGAQAGYWIEGVMPYVSLAYVRDLKVSTGGLQPASSDNDAWVASVGANLFSKGALSGGISYTEEFGRADSKNNTFMANIGYRF